MAVILVVSLLRRPAEGYILNSALGYLQIIWNHSFACNLP